MKRVFPYVVAAILLLGAVLLFRACARGVEGDGDSDLPQRTGQEAASAVYGMPDAVSESDGGRTGERRPGDGRVSPGAGDGESRFDRILALVRSGEAPEKTLRRSLFSLTDTTDPAALAILREAATSGNPRLRSLAALVLGRSRFDNTVVVSLLRSLLQDPSPEVISSAIRALGDRDLDALRQWGLPALEAGRLSSRLQGDLLVTLAAYGDEAAVDLAFAAAVASGDDRLVSTMLDQIGMLSDDVAVPLAQAVVESERASSALRSEALEALAKVGTPEAARHLLDYARDDASADRRRQAAEALATMVDARLPAADLAQAVTAEPDAKVRSYLFDAMLSIDEPDPKVLLPVIRNETAAEPRVMALFAAGTLCGTGQASTSMHDFFDAEAVSELRDAAQNSALPADTRLRAISALRNAGTQPALAAIEMLASSDDSLVRAAASRPLPKVHR